MAKESTSPDNWVPVPDPVFNARNYYDGGLKVFDSPLNVGDNGKSHRFNEKTGENELFTAVDLYSEQELSNKRLVNCSVELNGFPLTLAEDQLVVGDVVLPSVKLVEASYQKQTELLSNLLEALTTAPEGSLFRKGVGNSFEVLEPVENSVLSDKGWTDQQVTVEIVELMKKHIEKLSIELTALKYELAHSVDINSIRNAGSQ